MTHYSCTRCGRSLAHSGYSSCPHCGVRFAGVVDGGTRPYTGSGGSGGATKPMTPEEARAAGCLGAAVVAVAVVLGGLYWAGAWPFKKDANPPADPGAIASPPAGQPGQPAPPANANKITPTPTGLSFTPAFMRQPAPGSRLAFVYRATPAGGAPLDESSVRGVVIEVRYDPVEPPPGQHAGANLILGLRRMPLKTIEDDPAGTVLQQGAAPRGAGTGPPGAAPAAADAGWLVLGASKLRDGIRDGQPIAVEFPWAKAAAPGPTGGVPDRMAVSGAVAEFVPPKDGFGYRFSQLLTPVVQYPER